jgi:hypothetical protein
MTFVTLLELWFLLLALMVASLYEPSSAGHWDRSDG